MNKIVFLLVLLCMVCTGARADDTTYAAQVISNGDTTSYSSLTEAFSAANNTTGATLVFLDDREYGTNGKGLFDITSSMTIDGNGHTFSGYGIRGKVFTTLAINNGGTSMIDVTIRNMTIVNDAESGRPIETRGNIKSLTLDSVTIKATGSGTPQGLTIGGNQSTNASIYVLNSNIIADEGYPVCSFNPADIVVENSTFTGKFAMGLSGPKSSAGTRGSTIVAKKSEFDITDTDAGNYLFNCTDDGISIELEDCSINASSASAASCTLFALTSSSRTDSQDCSLTIKGDSTKVNAAELVYAADGKATVACTLYGGMYSAQPAASYVAAGRIIVQNTGDATGATYSYIVADQSAAAVTGTVYAGSSDAQTGQTLTQFAEIRQSQPNAIMIVGEEYAKQVKDQTNVIIKYSVGNNGNYYYECPCFSLTDWVTEGADHCADFYTPVDFIAVSGSYTRTLHANSQSCCLPFGVSSTGDMKIQIFSYYENAGDSQQYAYFTQPDSVSAGVPCLLSCDEATTYTKEFRNTAITSAPVNAYNMKGTFVASGDFNQTYCYGMMDTGAQFGAAPQTLYPFRTVLSLQDDSNVSTSSAKSITIAILDDEGNASAIDGTPLQIPHFNSDKSIYTITGIKVADTNIPGLYIIHGRKVLAK